MFSVQMISRCRLGLSLVFVAAALAGSCDRVPLLAPSGSTITLIASATALPVNGSTDIVAQVIEPSGTPPQRGTTVTFSTTVGSIQPSQAETDISGRVTVKFLAGTGSGAATITAISGGASVASTGVLKILVGTAAVGRVIVSANPTLVPALGGVTTIAAVILDINGNPLAGAPVSFSATAGTLADALVIADQSGLAQTTLRTSTATTVTASVGAQAAAPTTPTTPTTPPTTGTAAGQASGTVTVGIASSPTLVITPPATLSAGLPASFTFVVTPAAANGSAVRDVTVNWGDGQTQSLGALSGSSTVAHAYRSSGNYSINASVTDSSGNVVNVSTFVTVLSPVLTLTIAPPATAPSANLPANFTFTPAATTAGDAVRDVTVNWGDGSAVQDLGAISGATTVTHVFKSAGTYSISGTIYDTVGNSATVSTSVTVIPVARPSIIITPSPVPGHAGGQTTLTIQVTLPTGISVQDLQISFGDGQTADLGGAQSVAVPHVYTTIGTYTVTVTVVDTTGQTTVGTAIVSIGL